jgi:hypothetical protein
MTIGNVGSGFRAAAGLKSGQFNQKRYQFSSLKIMLPV